MRSVRLATAARYDAAYTATRLSRPIRAFVVVSDWFDGYGNSSPSDFLTPGEVFMTTWLR